MEYAVYEIKYDYDTDIETEARFYIASARADGAVLVRFDLRYGEEKRTVKRRLAVLVRLLKQMKRESLIQFFATEEDFTNMLQSWFNEKPDEYDELTDTIQQQIFM
jgi:hypothetical protein